VRDLFAADADPGVVERIAGLMSSAPPAIAIEALGSSLRNGGPVVRALPRIAAPVAAINPGWRPTDVDDLRRHGVAATVIPGGDHFQLLTDPDAVNRALERVIDGFGPPAGGYATRSPAW
jgi:hypothetical protein